MSVLDGSSAIIASADAPAGAGLRREALGAWVDRLAAYVELTKPRVTLLSLVTVVVGYLLGAQGSPEWLPLLHTVAAAALLAGGACALNQWLERASDASMRRTAGRPLPAGRMAPAAALRFGAALCLAGTVYLALAVHALAAFVGVTIAATYLLAYTPLKRRSTLNTAVGAVSGALPPVLGWAAASGSIDPGAWVLFLIVFLWQFPHFLAIAWLHRDDYARVGMKMLPAVDPRGVVTGYHVFAYTLTLLPVSLGPSVMGFAGTVYFVGAFALGASFLLFALRFRMHTQNARALLRASLLYLPILFALLLADQRPATARAERQPDRMVPTYRVAAAMHATAQLPMVNTDE